MTCCEGIDLGTCYDWRDEKCCDGRGNTCPKDKTCCDAACCDPCDPSKSKCCDDKGGIDDGYCCPKGKECCDGDCCDPCECESCINGICEYQCEPTKCESCIDGSCQVSYLPCPIASAGCLAGGACGIGNYHIEWQTLLDYPECIAGGACEEDYYYCIEYEVFSDDNCEIQLLVVCDIVKDGCEIPMEG